MELPIVQFYLDFVSPYTWLALMQAERFAEEHGVRWEACPIVYAALLDAHGLTGPVETPAKRRYTFQDVARSAHRLGMRLSGPPEHPFRSLQALRTLHLFRRKPQALRLAVRLSDTCWGEGKSLTDPDVIRDVVAGVGLDPEGLEQRVSTVEVKQGLREIYGRGSAPGCVRRSDVRPERRAVLGARSARPPGRTSRGEDPTRARALGGPARPSARGGSRAAGATRPRPVMPGMAGITAPAP